MDNFTSIDFPKSMQYSSDSDRIPIEFYESVFPLSVEIDMLLGYFSSNALKTLCRGFAEFIYNGGKLRIITNHELSVSDKENLLVNTKLDHEDIIIDIFSDIEKLRAQLGPHGVHFFDCLKYLLDKERLTFQSVKQAPDNLSHYKEILFFDGENYLFAHGSCNFTQAGLIKHGESFTVDKSWDASEAELIRISEQRKKFKLLFQQKHKSYKYLDHSEVIGIVRKVGNNRTEIELLEDAIIINDQAEIPEKVKDVFKKRDEEFKQKVEQIKQVSKLQIDEPTFPEKEPYPYQISAYEAWIKNNYKGLFAMATGTGKTLTALYCLINEFKKNKIQKNIFIVPGEELVRQWNADLKKSKFKHIFLWYSNNPNLSKEIEFMKVLKDSRELNIVITYDSFKLKRFQSIFKDSLKDFTIVFDEAHNIGATGFKNIVKDIIWGRLIGLSATPLRLWDDGNSNEFIEDLFNSHPPYTFSFPMEDAIKQKFLCPYNYYPYFSFLEDDEFDEYLYWTSLIPLGEDGKINSHAAFQRRLLLDSAANKSSLLIDIINELIRTNSYKYSLVYCPKGSRKKDQAKELSDDRIVHELGKLAADKFRHLPLNIQFFLGETEGRELLLNEFEDGNVDMLFAIKCLDEGVNVKVAQNAIFLASGKNYREFVQRRGRVLRNYNKGEFIKTHANIYDLVVLPTISQYHSHQETSLKLIIGEFKRLFEFYKMAIPNQNIFWKIENELSKYKLTQYYIEELILQEYE